MVDKILVQDSHAFDILERHTNFASYWHSITHAGRPVGCIVSGLELTNYDSSTPTIDVTSGKAVLTRPSGKNEQGEDIKGQSIPIQADSRQNISLTDNAVNEIYVEIVESGLNNVKIESTVGSEPTNISLKIGEVNTNIDVVSTQWNLLTEDGMLSYPSRSVVDEISSSLTEGTSVYNRGSSTVFNIIDTGVKSATTGTNKVLSNTTKKINAGQQDVASGPFTVNGNLSVDGSFTSTGTILGDGSITGTGTVGLTDTIIDTVEPLSPILSNNTYILISGWTTDNQDGSFDAYRFRINSSIEIEQSESLTFEKQ
jgi:hypothetical protein